MDDLTGSQMELVWGQMLVHEMELDLAIRCQDHEAARRAGRMWHIGRVTLEAAGISVPTE
jgi:hypothetical protein